MKSFILTLLVSISLLWVACEKSQKETVEKITVDQYIYLLKTSQYDSLELPAFSFHEIPELLTYANETLLIHGFPHNPISSLYYDECTLGIYVLWTIESIRSRAIESEYMVLGFPSLNPVLQPRNSDELMHVSQTNAQEIVANAYKSWWNAHQTDDFSDFSHIDPLENTPYKWH